MERSLHLKVYYSHNQDPFQKGVKKPLSATQVIDVKREANKINQELEKLEREMERAHSINVTDEDFLNELEELEESSDPSFKRFYTLMKSLKDQISLEDEILSEFDQSNLRERHYCLGQVEEAKEKLNEIEVELQELQSVRTNDKVIEESEVIAQEIVPETKKKLLDNIPVNPTPYNFQKAPYAPKSAASSSNRGRIGPKKYKADLGSYRKEVDIASQKSYFKDSSYSNKKAELA